MAPSALWTVCCLAVGVPVRAQDIPLPPLDIPGGSGSTAGMPQMPFPARPGPASAPGAPLQPPDHMPDHGFEPGPQPTPSPNLNLDPMILNAGSPAPKAAGTIPSKVPRSRLVLSARMADDGPPIPRGMVWRIFTARPGPDGKYPLVAELKSGNEVPLESGSYFVHCSFGHAERVVAVTVKGPMTELNVVLNAGGLKFFSMLGPGYPVPADHALFDILSADIDAQGDHRVVVANVHTGQTIRLTAGSYQVVAKDGDVNAQSKAEIEVRAGKLTEATITQQAGEVTFKLVEQQGGTAIAETDWSIFNPKGEPVAHRVGAFPSMVLATGTYSVVARHNNIRYTRDFTVENEMKKDIEVLTDKDKESNYNND